MSAAEEAVYATLSAGISGATVYQDVPADTVLPVVIVGDMKCEPVGGREDEDRRISMTVVAMVAAEERAPLLALQAQIASLLDGARLIRPGWLLAIGLEDEDALLAEDGVSYVGTSNFTILALTA